MAAVAPADMPKGGHVDSDIAPDSHIGDPEKVETGQDATDEESGAPSPQPAQELERWNETGVNIFRFFSTIYAFILMGMTDAAVGVRSILPPANRSGPH